MQDSFEKFLMGFIIFCYTVFSSTVVQVEFAVLSCMLFLFMLINDKKGKNYYE